MTWAWLERTANGWRITDPTTNQPLQQGPSLARLGRWARDHAYELKIRTDEHQTEEHR